MRDPHVVSLRYRLVTDDTTTFDKPPPVKWETDVFRLRLEDGTATVEMVEHFPSEEAAKERVEPYIHGYEVYAAINQYGRQEFHFEFDKNGTQMIDRDPPPPGSPQIISARATSIVLTTGRAVASIARGQYPTPPDQFVLSLDAEMMWYRYNQSLDGHYQSLAAMGYWCLSVLEASAGKSCAAAAKRYNISRKVLEKLGYLTSEVGDRQTARKAGTFRSHTPGEKTWIEAVVRWLILRVGQWAADPERSLPKLTLADLPKLT